MQSQMDLMKLKEPRELMAEQLSLYVEREVALLGMHPSLEQGQSWSHQWEAMVLVMS